MISKKYKIYVAGHSGMVGSAIIRKLKNEGFDNLIIRTSKELDLRNQKKTNSFTVVEQNQGNVDHKLS